MNLYALIPDLAASNEVELLIAKDDAEALEHGIFTAAHDACKGYGSPTASVFLVARNLTKVGTAHATDAPWPWAHPKVEEIVAELACIEAEYNLDHPEGS